MNAHTIWCLTRKDLHLNRRALGVYVAGGVLAVALSAVHDSAARGLGITLAVNVFIAACFQLVMGNVLGERERKTLAFTLAQPVSPRDVTAGKLLASLLCYVLCGLFAAVAIVFLAPVDVFAAAAHDGRGALSHALGWSAYFALVLGGFLVPFAAVLGTAIVSESLGWTIAVSSSLIFVLGNGTVMLAPRLRFLVSYARDLARGGPTLPATLVAELALVTAIVALTFWLQERKRDFV